MHESVRDYNQDSKTQSCRLGVNSGLASKMVLNFPKTDETRRGDRRETGDEQRVRL